MTGVQTCALPICFPVTIAPVKPFLDKEKWTVDSKEIPWQIYQYTYSYTEDGDVSMGLPTSVTLQEVITKVLKKYKVMLSNSTFFKEDHDINCLTLEHMEISKSIETLKKVQKEKSIQRRKDIAEEETLVGHIGDDDKDGPAITTADDDDYASAHEIDPTKPLTFKKEEGVKPLPFLDDKTLAALATAWEEDQVKMMPEETCYEVPHHELIDNDLQLRAESKIEQNMAYINYLDREIIPGLS